MQQRRQAKRWLLVLLLLVVVVITSSTLARRRRRHHGQSVKSLGADYDITWAPDHITISDSGERIDLLLDDKSGAGFGSKASYLFGRFELHIRLVAANHSAGTTVAYYMSSLTDDRDEFNFEFIGGQPYTMQTNMFIHGVGGREQRFSLWFDPSQSFHSYSLTWNTHQIVFWVDNVPVRVYRNKTALGVPYASSKPMGVYSSIWSSGGIVDWTHGPLTASYNNLSTSLKGACNSMMSSSCYDVWPWDEYQQSNLTWVRTNFLIYDYCTTGNGPECIAN